MAKRGSEFSSEVLNFVDCYNLQVVLTPTHLAIVMEYAAGGELFERICNAGRFSEDEVISTTFSLFTFTIISSLFDPLSLCLILIAVIFVVNNMCSSFFDCSGSILFSAADLWCQLLSFHGNIKLTLPLKLIVLNTIIYLLFLFYSKYAIEI